MKTIFALTTGSKRAGVAVIRVSGDLALDTYKSLTGKDKSPEPRYATYAKFYNPDTKALLDKGIAIYFKGPNSFTGEDVVEYHIHGGKAIIDAFTSVLAKQPNCRMAEPGEFTKRAFENDKMDLTAAEAVADLIDAETEAQRCQALDQLDGRLSTLYRDWADKLKGLLAHQEADIEFPDEDMPEQLSDSLKAPVKKVLDAVKDHLDDKRRGERLREGLLIAIIGAPNAGKSSLLNALAQRDAAIVSDEAGTTRDVIEVHLDLGGFPVILADTAGLRETENKVEVEGIKRAQKVSRDAGIKIALFDGSINKCDKETEDLMDENTITVITKSDVSNNLKLEGAINISAKTGEGIDALLAIITKKLEEIFYSSDNAPSLTRERHRLALEETRDSLERSLNAELPELAAEDLRLAVRSLGSITGTVHVEELLDKIFKDFCIGK